MKKAFLIAALVAALVLSGCIMPTPDSTETEQSHGIILPDNQQSDNQQSDNQQSDNQQSDNQQSDNQQSDNQQSDNQQPNNQQQDNQQPIGQQQLVQCPDGSMAVSANLCISLPGQPPVNPGVLSCGSIDITNLAMATGSEEEKANLACFNQNMVSCINSTFELTGQFGGLFSVLGEEGTNCLISYYDNTDLSQKTCRFPKTFVESTINSSEQAGQPELPLLLFSGAMKGMNNPLTGNPFEIECN